MSFMLFLCAVVIGCGGASNQTAEQPPETVDSQPLDLSQESIRGFVEEVDGETNVELTEPGEILPELLSEDKAEKSMRVSGNVLTKEEAESLQDSVDGVELKLEVKTK
ncbi:MAG: hypothetical protein AAF541_18350 [Pseudomonadota bacterium]